ncbi:MAG: fatty acid desaturase family protein [Gammaproteobacteria bacterium]
MQIRDVLTAAETETLTRSSDARGAWLVLCQWTLTALIFAGMAVWPNVLTLGAGIVLLGGRQLGFGVLVHECGHRSLFRSQALNTWVGDWLLAAPTFNNQRAYMRAHVGHHRLAGTPEDPDLPNYQDYPISATRLRRKLWRDLSGRTGLRTLAGIGRGLRKFRALPEENQAALRRGLLVNLALLATLIATGFGWLYGIWLAAFVFANPAISRIRQIAEHAAVPDRLSADPRRNTRTVLAGPLARLVLCPHQINYHLEHHLLASVPIYRLAALHLLLQRKGWYRDVDFPTGYRALFRQVLTSR